MMNLFNGTDQSSTVVNSTTTLSSSTSKLKSSEKISASNNSSSVLNNSSSTSQSKEKDSYPTSALVFVDTQKQPSSIDHLLHIDQYSSLGLKQTSDYNKSTTADLDNSSSSINSASNTGIFMEFQAIHPVIKSFMIGSVSGTCSTILFQPLDLLKTRLQQAPTFRHTGATATAAAHPAGIVSVVGHILRDEKFLGLWKGITPSLSRCVPGVGLYFASIHGLKMTFDIKGDPSALESVLLGVTGRSFSGVLMIPFTVIKTRFESKVYQYGSIREALGSIYKKEGVRGLTCGLIPTLLRDAPFSGIYLLMYTSTKKAVGKEWMESPALGPYVRFSCGVVAGIGASLITQPFDVIKTKMQLYPDKFHHVREVIPYVYKKYGAQGYFKGLMPRMVRRTLIAAMSWTVYEHLVHSMGLK